jgi:hypothetical protein
VEDFCGINETFLCDSVPSRSVAIKGYKFVRNDRTVRVGPGVGGSRVGFYMRYGLGFKVIARSSESGVELFVEVKLRNRVVLVATIYGPPNTSVVYHSLDGDYDLQALKEICSDLLRLYGEFCLLGDFNVDLLDPGHSLFARFLDFLKMFM